MHDGRFAAMWLIQRAVQVTIGRPTIAIIKRRPRSMIAVSLSSSSAAAPAAAAAAAAAVWTRNLS